MRATGGSGRGGALLAGALVNLTNVGDVIGIAPPQVPCLEIGIALHT